MTAYASVKIWCDWPGCYARIDTSRARVADARVDAARHGWKRVAGMLDLCGPSEQADNEYGLLDTRGWRNCAARTDHRPVIKPAGKGDVKLSCVCGWSYESPHAWARKGTVVRSSAAFHWQQHAETIKQESAARPAGGDS